MKGLLRHALRAADKVTNVKSQLGAAVRHKVSDGIVEIELPMLDLYESILVEYQC